MPTREAVDVTMSRRSWDFTLHNWTEAQDEYLKSLGESGVFEYLTYGYETCPTTGTPHLQGMVVLQGTSRRTMQSMQSALGQEEWSHRISLRPLRTSHAALKRYCQKSEVFQEWGTCPQQGKRSDLDEVIEYTNENPSWTQVELARRFTRQAIMYRNMFSVLELIRPFRRGGDEGVYGDEGRNWQITLHQILQYEADDRKVIVVVDKKGGAGKSYFMRTFHAGDPEHVQCLTAGRATDIACAVKEETKYFFFDMPRTPGLEFLSWNTIEQLKDKNVFSGKFVSRTKFLKGNVHVVIFTNEDPDLTKLSQDRWVCYKIDDDMNLIEDTHLRL